MFQVLPISSHTGTQPSTPLVNCLIDVMLLQTRPCSSQVPLQISDVEYGSTVGTLLHDTPELESGRDWDCSHRSCGVAYILMLYYAVTVVARFYKVQ